MMTAPLPRRRHLALVAVLAVGAAAAGTIADAAAPSSAPPDGTRVVATINGDVTVPVDPTSIVVLDEYAAMTMLSLGIEADRVIGSYQSVVGAAILQAEGIEVLPGMAGGGINIEQVADLEPDLIVATEEFWVDGVYEQLSALAPTIVFPYGQPSWRDVITDAAEAFDRAEVGADVIAILETHLAATPVDDPASTLSVLFNTVGFLGTTSPAAPLTEIIADAGWDRPAAQRDSEPDEMYVVAASLSPEVIGDHDADAVVVFSGNYYDADAVTALPTYQNLSAVIDGRAYIVDGDMWFGTFPFAVYWIGEDLAAVAAGDADGIGTSDDVDARWQAFSELTA